MHKKEFFIDNKCAMEKERTKKFHLLVYVLAFFLA